MADRAERATGFADRFLGLMGRRSLAVGEGMHIVPCNSIHTFFMRIAIDVAFLDPDGLIVKQIPAMPPWRMSSVYFKAQNIGTATWFQGTVKLGTVGPTDSPASGAS